MAAQIVLNLENLAWRGSQGRKWHSDNTFGASYRGAPRVDDEPAPQTLHARRRFSSEHNMCYLTGNNLSRIRSSVVTNTTEIAAVVAS